MRTESDITDALFALEDDAPAIEDVLVGLRREEPSGNLSTRRHGWTIAAAAAAIVAVAVLIPLTRHGNTAPAAHRATGTRTPVTTGSNGFDKALPAPAANASPDLHLGFAIAPVAGVYLKHLLYSIDRQGQFESLEGTTATSIARVSVYYAGAFDATEISHARPVTVNGRPGYYTQLDGNADALAWEYAAGGWAVVSIDEIFPPALTSPSSGTTWGPGHTSPGSPKARSSSKGNYRPPVLTAAEHALVRSDELRVAEATHAATVTLLVPFRLRAGSPGYVVSFDPPSGGSDVGADLGSVDVTDTRSGQTWSLIWDRHTLGPASDASVPINGRPWVLNVDLTSVRGVTENVGLPGTGAITLAPGFSLMISNSVGTHPATAVPVAEITKFIGELDLASNPSDPSTWFDASTAFP